MGISLLRPAFYEETLPSPVKGNTSMIHGTPRVFSDVELHQLTIVNTAHGCYELRLGTTPIMTVEGRPVSHPSYKLIDAIRCEAWLHAQLDVTQSGVYGVFCMHYDAVVAGNDGISDYIPDILQHHESLIQYPPRFDGQVQTWCSVIEWLAAANLHLPSQACRRDATFDQFVRDSYQALSSAQRAVVSYLFHQHTTSVLLPMMVAMGYMTASMYAAAMCMTTVHPTTRMHAWPEYRQYHHHFLGGAQASHEYLWLVVA